MKSLTEGPPGKLIFQFALPMLIGNVFQQMYNFVDSIVVGRYVGKEALAAVGASFPLIFILVSFIIGITIGSTIMIAQYFGAKEMEKVRQTIDTMYISLFFASILVTVLGMAFSRPIFSLIHLAPDVIPKAMTYFNIFLVGTLFFFGFNGTSAILRGLGDSKTPLYFLIISTVMNLILAVIFVGVLRWGIGGSAWATVIAQGGAFITAIIYLNKTHKIVRLNLKTIRFDKQIFIKSLKIGLPTGIQQTFVAIGMLGVIRIVNEFGTDVMAAYSTAGRLDSLAVMPAMNFSAALSTFVGQNLGAGKPHRVKHGLLATFKMSSLTALATTILIVIFRSQLMGLFTTDADVIRIGGQYLVIVSSFYFFFSTMFVISGVMRGAGDTLIPMFISLFTLWLIRIPLAWFLSRHLGSQGIWWSMPIAWFCGALFSYLYYLKGNWKSKVLVKVPVNEPIEGA